MKFMTRPYPHHYKRLVRVLALLPIGFFLSLPALAQLSGNPGEAFKVNIIPPSPEAASLAKYADIPVSLYSGTPKVDIPLYTIKERELTLPISVSYHGSGNKVGTEASRVGLGWSLNAGGVVTRTARGWPDEFTTAGFLHQAIQHEPEDFALNVPAEQRWSSYDAMARNCQDLEPDLFYFNFAGYSGRFMFNWDGEIAIGSQQSLKITPLGMNPGTSDFIDGFEIVVEDGTIFVFTAIETSLVTNASNSPNCALALETTPVVSSWYLTEVWSPGRTTWIKLEYQPHSQVTQSWTMETMTHNGALGPAASQRQRVTTTIAGKHLSRISTSTGQTTVTFHDGLPRADIGGNSSSLGQVVIKNNRGRLIGDWRLGYDYSTGRLTLKSITEWAGDTSKPPYRFEYNSGQLPSALSFSQDHWGFANDNRTGNTLIPPTAAYTQADPPMLVRLPGAERNSSDRSLDGMLQKITYPTGGTDFLEFELHDYSFLQNMELITPVYVNRNVGVGAPRDNTPEGEYTQEVVEFTFPSYGKEPMATAAVSRNLTFGGGVFYAAVELRLKNSSQPVFSLAGDTIMTQPLHLVSNSVYQLTARARKPPAILGHVSGRIDVSWKEDTGETKTEIRYGGGVRIKRITRSFGNGNPDKITRYIYRINENGREKSSGSLLETGLKYEEWIDYKESALNNPVKKFFRYSTNRCPLGTTQGSHVGYSAVTVQEGEHGENGKTVYSYTSPRTVTDYHTLQIPYPPAESHDYARGLVTQEEVYDSAGRLLKKVVYKYSVENTDWSKTVVGIKTGFIVPGAEPFGPSFIDRYNIAFYRNYLGYPRLRKKTETIAFPEQPGASFETSEKYTYNEAPGHRQLIVTATSTNNGDTIFTKTTFPQDYPSGDIALDKMKSQHIVDQPIEIITWKKTGSQLTLLSGLKNDFAVHLGRPRVASVKGARIAKPLPTQDPTASVQDLYEDRLLYHVRDIYGNPTEHSAKHGKRTAYVWGGNGTLLYAVADNAKASEIFYTSFEDDPSATLEASKTGIKCKMLQHAHFTIPGTDFPPGNYVLSYWVKESGAWTFRQRDVQGYQSGHPIVTEDINGYLDEVRLHPQAAHMTSYTYEPLTGITSATDPNGLTTYYEYDLFNRLTCKRDNDHNIIGSFGYIYQQPIPYGLPPTINGFAPAEGKADTEVVITGSNFSLLADENSVQFNNVTATVLSASENELKVKVPTNATTGKISVTIDGAKAVSDLSFSVKPVLISFAPQSGVARTSTGLPGTRVTIEGTGLTSTGNNVLKFNGALAEVVSSTPTEVVANVPVGATTGKITMTVAGITTESPADFTVLDRNSWHVVADYAGGMPRTHTAGFVIGKKIYLGTGQDQNNQKMKDFWEYDSETNTWTRKADFPGTARTGAVAFSIGAKGYLGLGQDTGYPTDFWEYDPSADSWMPVANFPGSGRGTATAFTIADRAYVTTGSAGLTKLSDLWEYNPATNSWSQKQSIPVARTAAFSFVIGSSAYVGGSDGALKDIWEYSAVQNVWSRKADAPSTLGGGAAFAIGEKGYVQVMNSLLEYNPALNMWTEKASLPATLSFSKGFAVNNFSGFLGTGITLPGYAKTKAFYQYIPD